jgi:outer membrane protein assembly factor BamB
MIADGLIFAIDDGGTLSLIEATPEAWRPLDQAAVLEGPDAWGPMALADGRLILRDLNRMICLDVAAR